MSHDSAAAADVASVKSHLRSPRLDPADAVGCCSAMSPEDIVRFSEILRTNIFPILLIVSCVGNGLNIVILNSRGMRSRTNCFLTAMAVADLGFYICASPIFLARFDGYRGYPISLQEFVIRSRTLCVVFANWFSASSTWLAIAVTAERLHAIRSITPTSRTQWEKRPVIILLSSIFIAAFFVPLYHFAWYNIQVDHGINRSMNGTAENETDSDQLFPYVYETPLTENDPARYWYTYVAHAFSIAVVIILPLIILIVLNCCLIYFLRQKIATVQRNLKLRRNSSSSSAINRDRRSTWTVIVVISFVILLDFPSGFANTVDLIMYGKSYEEKVAAFPSMGLLDLAANFLICVNRTLSIFLYTCTNREFRRRLIDLIRRRKVDDERRESSKSVAATGGDVRKESSTTRTMDDGGRTNSECGSRTSGSRS